MSIVRCPKFKKNKPMHNKRAKVLFQSKLLRANRFAMALPCVCILCLLSIECRSIEQYTIVLMAYGIRTCSSLSRNNKRKLKEDKRKVPWLKIASECHIALMCKKCETSPATITPNICQCPNTRREITYLCCSVTPWGTLTLGKVRFDQNII